jgi:hypothetical protein
MYACMYVCKMNGEHRDMDTSLITYAQARNLIKLCTLRLFLMMFKSVYVSVYEGVYLVNKKRIFITGVK